MPKEKNNSPRVCVVFGGGLARGAAHIGVLKALKCSDIPIDMVVGTSAGAFMGALYAAGMPLGEMEKKAQHLRWWDILSFGFSATGIFSPKKIQTLMTSLIGAPTFAELHTPLAVTAVDLISGKLVILRDGDVGEAVMASCIMPGIYQPYRKGEMMLADGGLRSCLPVSVARQLGANIVIAISLGFLGNSYTHLRDPYHILFRAFDLAAMQISEVEQRDADVLIAPDIEHLLPTNFACADELIRRGEAAATKALPSIQACLKRG